MYRRIFLTFAFLAVSATLAVWPAEAQTVVSIRERAAATATGGVKGTVVSRSGRTPVAGASIELAEGGDIIVSGTSGNDGTFLFEGIADGMYNMRVSAPGFATAFVNVTIERGFVKNLMFVSLVPSRSVMEADDSSFAEFDMDDSGYSDTPSILFSNDVYTDIVGFGFSAIRFKNRGYSNESQDVCLSGVKMNDAITGYSPYSLWSGLNEATRSKETTIGNEASDYGAGGWNGVTNILATPSSVRPGWRFSVLSNSAMYRLRLMATYASGELDSGWSYAFNVSARMGGNDWVKGVYYRNFAYYAGVEKKFGDEHRLSFAAFAAPGQRGAQNAATQEVYDLMGDNMYNSNWGLQNGKVRNARVRKTHEPVFVLKYTATPSENLEASATLLYRTGKNGYTALDWYDAPDPRPDYYRNLPSYFYNSNPDYNRNDPFKAAWAEEAWLANYNSTCHLNWDRLYNVNFNNQVLQPDGTALSRSKYAIEERRVDQNDVNAAANVKWTAGSWFTLSGGANFKWNRTEYFKKLDDLLGGDYYINIDQFAERDFASSPAMIQNDLDYFLAHGDAERVGRGGKYGYDYYAHVRNASVWANGIFTRGGFTANVALEADYTRFWREGLLRKGLFAGLDDSGREIFYDGQKLTSYDSYGKVISSKGDSEKASFLTWSAKAGASYVFRGGHRIYANAGWYTDAPTFSQSFISPRTRNTLVAGLEPSRTVSADINYSYSNNGYDLRVSGFWTKIMNQTDLMSFYDDSQNSFTNFAMTGIDQRHAGLELGFRIPFFLKGLSLQGALSLGEYIYTSTPRMTQTIDNSAAVVFENQPVTYWKSHPVYKSYMIDGVKTYEVDLKGNYVAEKMQKHYVAGSPQLASSLAFNYRTNSYWFFTVEGQYFANSYLDMNPLYRTDMAVSGPDGIATPVEIEYMAAQEKFGPVFLLNASAGKSWYIKRKYNFGFSLNVNNILNNRNVRTGGYEQTRLIDSKNNERYYRFDPKYFYMSGINYMLNLYFRF